MHDSRIPGQVLPSQWRDSGLKTGAQLGEYILDNRIGSGATGEVWKAHHHVWVDNVVAVKVATNPEFVNAIRNDGLVRSDLSRLDSPHLVRLIGLNVANDPPYLVMEHVPGGSLRDQLNTKGRLALDEALRILDGVLKGLAVAHRAGVVHRDLKPENVLLDADGTARLTDFSVATTVAGEHSLKLSLSADTNQARSIAGTLVYMSPEQRQAKRPDARSDVYSMGVMMFEMLTGELPQPGDRVGDYLPGAPEAVEQLFARCFARPDKRFADAAQMLEATHEVRRAIGRKATAKVMAGKAGVAPAVLLPAAPTRERPAVETVAAPALPTTPSVARRTGKAVVSTRDTVPVRTGDGEAKTRRAPKLPPVISTRDIPLVRAEAKPAPLAPVAHPAVRAFPAAAAELDELLRGLPEDPPGGSADAARALGEIPTLLALYRQRETEAGIAAYARGDIPKAAGEFRRVLEVKPSHTPARRGLAMCLYQQGKPKSALELYRQIVNSGEATAEIWNNIGVISTDLGRLRDAERALLHAVELRPHYAAAHANLGAVYQRTGRKDLAQVHSKLALELDPENLAAGYNLTM